MSLFFQWPACHLFVVTYKDQQVYEIMKDTLHLQDHEINKLFHYYCLIDKDLSGEVSYLMKLLLYWRVHNIPVTFFLVFHIHTSTPDWHVGNVLLFSTWGQHLTSKIVFLFWWRWVWVFKFCRIYLYSVEFSHFEKSRFDFLQYGTTIYSFTHAYTHIHTLSLEQFII